MKRNCKKCNAEYFCSTANSMFCSVPCRKEYNLVEKCKAQGLPTITGMICGAHTRSIISHIKNHKEWGDPDKYKLDFPGAPIESPDVVEKKRVGSVIAGRRMRDPDMMF